MSTEPTLLPPTTSTQTRDTFLDAVKAIAISRVIAWHTWSWWWLSWIGAMPAMFFASGALLDLSLERHGYRATVRNRFRRLLIPFWWYSACAVVVMVAVGWRPSLSELAPWIIPLGDPVGSSETPGLWIPLWYVRAYLWFVIGAGILRAGVDLAGRSILALPVLATSGLWFLTRSGIDVPLALGDAATYSFFVLLGMLYARGDRLRGRNAFAVGAAALVSAIAWWAAFGPDSGIVNASYPLLLLAGVATVGMLLALAPALRELHGLPSRLVDVIGSRALTIYLWQGFGLLAADQLVTRREVTGPGGAVAAIVVVVTVTSAAAWAFGWIEDLAAARRPRLPHARLVPLGAMAVAVLVGAAALEPASGTTAALPPSGQAVIDRSRYNETRTEVEGTATRLDPAVDPVERVQAAFDDWVARSRDALGTIGSERVEAAVTVSTGQVVRVSWIDGGGEPENGLVPWMSMSKAVTGAWLAQLAADGIVALDDPVSAYLPDVPHGDEITLGHLVRHRSGIPTEYDDGEFYDANPRLDLEEWFDDPRLAFDPGGDFAYSRRGYFLLAWALEEASGESWTAMVHRLERGAGVDLVIDEELDPWPEISHPGDGEYRGRTWAAGGLAATFEDTARFHRWLLTDGITARARDLMTRFVPDMRDWDYGLALLPLCPCERDGEWLRAPRYGLDAALGTWAFDEDTTAVVFLKAHQWLHQGGDAIFYELQDALLDAAGSP